MCRHLYLQIQVLQTIQKSAKKFKIQIIMKEQSNKLNVIMHTPKLYWQRPVTTLKQHGGKKNCIVYIKNFII